MDANAAAAAGFWTRPSGADVEVASATVLAMSEEMRAELVAA